MASSLHPDPPDLSATYTNQWPTLVSSLKRAKTTRLVSANDSQTMAGAGHNHLPDPGSAGQRGETTQLKVSSPSAFGQASQPKCPTFAAVTKAKGERRFPPIQLATRQYGCKDGKPSIPFSTAELQVGIDNLKYSLVVKFSVGRPPIEEVRKVFSQSWALNGPCSIGAWDARHILIVLQSELDARKVLAHPVRKLGHSYFRVFRWSTEFDTKKEPTTTTTWVRLLNLPPQLYNQGYMESIVSSFGKFLAVDNMTASFQNPSFARVCIEMDVSKTPPDAVWISTGPQTGFWLKLLYENRLLYCSKCHIHGHQLETCRKAKQRRVEEQKIWEARDDHGLPTGSPTGAYSKPVQGEDKSGQKPAGQTSMVPVSNVPKEGNQEWKLVQNRKQKKKSFKHLCKTSVPHPGGRTTEITDKAHKPMTNEVQCPSPNPIQNELFTSSMLDKTHILPPAGTMDVLEQCELQKLSKIDNNACNTPGATKEKDKFVYPTLTCQKHKSSNAGLWVKEGPTVSTKYAFPPLTFLRRNRDMDTANINKSSIPGASQKNLPITKSPRSACRRSPPVILLPRSYCLPTMDVQHPPTL
ncbi:unnamed protein product [Rhodiola kirilowii]